MLELELPQSPVGCLTNVKVLSGGVNIAEATLQRIGALETGGVLVGDEVAITIDVEAIKK